MTNESNREKFLAIVNSIEREGMKKEDLINYLELHSDFFTAPASAMYHCSYEGGLLQHSLNVYNNLVSILWKMGFIWKEQIGEEKVTCVDDDGREYSVVKPTYTVKYVYSPDTVKIVALFHDFSKCNYYETGYRNVKEYCENGTKHDAGGNYEWVTKQVYQKKSFSDRFCYGTTEQNSEFKIRQFIPLEIEESVAILNCRGESGSTNAAQVAEVFNRYPLAAMLHVADILATFVNESEN